MQPIIDITSTKTATKTGTARATGRPYTLTNQRGYFNAVDPITGEITRLPIDVRLSNETSPYPIGRYTIDSTSFRVDEYNNLVISLMRLDPLPASVASVPHSGKSATAA